MSLPSYMYGTPEELRQRAKQWRAAYTAAGPRGDPRFDPAAMALNKLESFALQDPASQNLSFKDAATEVQPNMSPWQQYSAVLGARGASTPFGTPSSIRNDPTSTFNTNSAGPR